ncbi:diguanylate cyclase (GGDEF)-like protein/PAS domain S-box-containing protein [Kineococcus radiotolerans]|uniref:Diguanylate cyclase (GGDEF)-like protein/PAS domain S-box-containing protein n=1 Tax=Kineococcus radiotolerans TaxID=131568 RepID=A0A7W4TPE0_KINRA|nr:PAS domain S-box protein [Kineococcus radiotolerans]MBB2902678.1 diguanylate cyclase (GGDEF)-like protein/PAS domain S-box-containing protein [Kineococcus radiotolerans]
MTPPPPSIHCPERNGNPAEVQRLTALREYDVLGAPADAELDDVVRAAAMLAGVPHATLNLIDEHRQCQLATVGFEGTDSAREDSMCALHFTGGEVVHLPDAAFDPRYRTNPWVDGRLGRVRLYASAPLITPRGHAVGSLCVFDTVPGELFAAQLDALAGLARVVVALFERRRKALLAERYAAEAHQHALQAQRLSASDAELRLVLAATSDAFLAVDENQRITSWNAAAEAMFGWSQAEALGRGLVETIVPPAMAAAHTGGFERFLRTGARELSSTVEVPARRRDGTELVVELSITPVEAGGQRKVYAAIRDVTDRRRLEQQARSLAGIVAGARDAIVSVDTAGRITSWNAAAEQLYGYDAARVTGAGLDLIAASGEVQQLGAWLARAAAGEAVDGVAARDVVGRHRDGSAVEVSITVSPVLDAAGAVVGASIAARDISERLRAEAALREAEQRFGLAFTHAPTGVLLTALSGEHAGRFLSANPAACAMLGHSAEALQHLTSADVTHPEDLPTSQRRVREVVEGRTPSAHFEERYVRADGRTVWGEVDISLVHDAGGRPLYTVTHVQDVTAKRADRQRLAESEQRFRLAFDTAPVGMVIVGLGEEDAARILQVNTTLCEFTGLSVPELLGRDVHDLVDPEERVDSLLGFAPFLLGELTHGQVEQRYRHADGTVRWGLMTVTAMTAATAPLAGVPGADDAGPQLLCLIEDVTARKAAELALRHQALHDGLTGLPNRTLLHDRLEHALAAAGRSGAGVGVLFCDLDGFKAVNDSAGHAAGDELLREVAARFGGCLRPGDTLARLGGDEFAVVCPDLAGPADLRAIAERLLGSLREPVVLAAGAFGVGVSVGAHLAGGCAAGDGAGAAVDQALAHADTAMYEAKRAGKNRVRTHDDGAGDRCGRGWPALALTAGDPVAAGALASR